MYYKGGDGIDRFRVEPGGLSGPEDWVGSLTRLPRSMLETGVSQDTGVSMTSSRRNALSLLSSP